MSKKTLLIGFVFLPIFVAGLRLFAGQFDGTSAIDLLMIPFYIGLVVILIYWFKIIAHYLDKYNQKTR